MHFTIRTEAQRDAVIEHIRQRHIEKPFEVDVRVVRGRRSLPQLRLLFLYYTAFGNETGNDSADLHEAWAERYYPKKIINILGKEVSVRTRTAELEKPQMSEHIDRVRRDMAAYGYPYPSPDSPIFEEFYQQYRDRIS